MDNSERAAEIFNKHAEQYAERFMDFDKYDLSFDKFCDAIEKKDAEVLELACGPGNITCYLLQKRPDFKILATDLAPKMLELAKQVNPGIDTQILDCRKFKSLNRKFDAIMCGFGLPYLTKDEAIHLIAAAAECLDSKGILYISTMEDDNNKSGFKKGSAGDEIFMNYHEAVYLMKALKDNGFEVINEQRHDFQNHDGTMAVDLLIVARKL